MSTYSIGARCVALLSNYLPVASFIQQALLSLIYFTNSKGPYDGGSKTP